MSIDPSLRDLAEYLIEIGYGDVYRTQRREPPRADATTPATRAAPADATPSHPTTVAIPPASASHPEDRQRRAAELARVGDLAAACTACKLATGRRSVVFGAGDPNAELMFIGEGPGAEEDRQGLPFVGRAGELLTRMIQAMELRRDQVYIANVVKCRPPNNRDPEPDEVSACRGFLEQQIALVQPRVVCALGRIAAQTLLGVDTPIGRLRGAWHTVLGVPAMVTYHPAALLRNPALKRPTWEDLQQVRDRLRSAAT